MKVRVIKNSSIRSTANRVMRQGESGQTVTVKRQLASDEVAALWLPELKPVLVPS